MTDEDSQQRVEGDLVVEAEHPHHHHSTGSVWLDRIIGVSAIVISVISVSVALHSSSAMNRLVQSNSMPFLSHFAHWRQTNGLRGVSLSLSNEGVGPADIRTVQVTIDGKPVPDIVALMKACCGSVADSVNREQVTNRMLRPGESAVYLDLGEPLTPRPVVDQVRDLALADRLVTRICYCSVFDECWTLKSSAKILERPVPVAECPAVPVPYH